MEENTEELEKDNIPTFGAQVHGPDQDTPKNTIVDAQSGVNNHGSSESNILNLETKVNIGVVSEVAITIFDQVRKGLTHKRILSQNTIMNLLLRSK